MRPLRLQDLPIYQTRRIFGPEGLLPSTDATSVVERPKISIVTPSYNQGEFLEECIVSVLEQGYPNLEYVVMDGGSTDRSVEIIRKYEKYLTYWQSQKDGGQYWAIDAGLKRASGEIMAWLNSDDKYHPGALATVADAFVGHPQVEWLTGRPTVWNDKGDLSEIHLLRPFTLDDYLDPAEQRFIQQESTFWRRSLWLRAGGRLDTELNYAGDLELWVRFFGQAPHYMIDALLGGFRVHPAQKTAVAMERYLQEAQQVRKRTPRVRPPAVPAKQPPKVEIVTSIRPGELDRQQPAIRSWLKLGFRVTSVNHARHIAGLNQHYPGVRFQPVRASTFSTASQIALKDVLAPLRQSSASILGLLSPDVLILADDALTPFLATTLTSNQATLLYDYAPDNSYTSCFNLFFFNRAFLHALPVPKARFGAPWSNEWLALQALRQNARLQRLDAHLSFSAAPRPPLKWSDFQPVPFEWLDYLAESERLAIAACRQAPERPPQEAPGADDVPPAGLAMLLDAVHHDINAYAQRIDYPGPCALYNRMQLGKPQGCRYRVSAIVSTYASADFIRACLQNLLDQTIASDLEIIVIDADSPEDEQAIVGEFAATHDNIRYVRTEQRIGIYAAWNMAIRMAQGGYLISCSTNDRLRPDALEWMARSLDEQPQVAIVYGNSYLTHQPHQCWERFTYAGHYIWPRHTHVGLLRAPGIGPHPMWRRRLHDEFGWFNERYAAISDQDFWLRVSARHPLLNLSRFTGLYLLSDDSLSGKRSRAQSEYRQIVEQHRREYAYRLWREGRYFTSGMAELIDAELARWEAKPRFTLFIRHTQSHFDELSATIRALTAQLYDSFQLVILSPIAAPPGTESTHLMWRQCPTEHWALAVNRIAADLGLDHTHWLTVVRDGDRLSEHALLTLAQAIHAHPDWHVLYVDEDELDIDGDHCAPHFKPAFDSDHVWAAPYSGDTLFFRADRFADLGGLVSELPDAETFDLMLRAQEAAGPTAIGHVADILLSRPAGRWSPYPRHSHAQAVANHLDRRGARASLQFDEGRPLRIDFQSPAGAPAPSVALLVYPASRQLAALEQAITSLLEKTPPQPFTLYAIDPGPRHADIQRFLQQLDGLNLPNLVCLPAPADVGPSQVLRAALPMLREDYILLWPDDAVAVQANWLAPLLAHFNRPTAPSAVGPRLANAAGQLVSAGEIAGLCGPSGAPYKGVFLDYPGENAWLQSDHRAHILDGRCLLVRRSAVVAAGGLDVAGGGDHWAADLCLRLAAQGPLLWTPASTVMVRESLEQLEQEDSARRQGELDDARIATLLRWRPHIADQIAAQPHLNMEARDLVPDTRSALTYAPLAGLELPRIYAHAADREGCGHYRILQPLEALLSNARVSGGAATDPLPPARMVADTFDTLIFQRPHTAPMLRAMRHYRQLSGALRIFEVDDLLTDVPANSPHARDFGPDAIALFKQALNQCNRLVVPTEALAQAYGHMVDEVRVVPNYLPMRIWNTLTPAKRSGNRPRVGWAGSISHLGDLALLIDVVKALADEVDWVFFGTCCWDMLPYVRENRAAVPFPQYPAALAGMGLDLAIAPIASNAFNEAKSNLKLLEYGILGYPVVCSDIGPYRQDFPVKRVANTPQAWIAAIRERIHDPDATRQEGLALQAHVRRHWMLDDHLEDWFSAWTR